MVSFTGPAAHIYCHKFVKQYISAKTNINMLAVVFLLLYMSASRKHDHLQTCATRYIHSLARVVQPKPVSDAPMTRCGSRARKQKTIRQNKSQPNMFKSRLITRMMRGENVLNAHTWRAGRSRSCVYVGLIWWTIRLAIYSDYNRQADGFVAWLFHW